MAIIYFGNYSREYSRNRIIIKGLRKNGVDVVECNASGGIVQRSITLVSLFLKNQKISKDIIVGFPGQTDVPLAFILAKLFRKKLFVDIFASKYESFVLDRQHHSKKSLISYIYYFVDFVAFRLADYIIADTKEHFNYWKKLFKLTERKKIVLHLGSDDEIFYPGNKIESVDVLFYGYFQPLHGTLVILEAAKMLPKVKFKLIGYGQEKKIMLKFIRENRLKNIIFSDPIHINKLSLEIRKAKIILGIFGLTKKAYSVIPNKVFDGLASKKAIITANTPAALEILINETNCLLVEPGDGFMLKVAIERLLKNIKLRDKLAENGFKLFTSKLKPEIVVRPLLKYLND